MTAAFINPSSFSYESAGFTDDNANVYQTPTNPSFEVWTNSSGDIESWNITIRGEELIIMSVWAPQAGFPNSGGDSIAPGEPLLYGYDGENGYPGTWAVSTTGITVPEPASGALQIAGLVVLAGLALKKYL